MKPAYLLIALIGATLPAGQVVAGDHRAYNIHHPAYQAECGSCHIPYPPRLLPARSWRALMKGLDQHFGSDASLDAGTATTIMRFLEQNAGRDRTGSSTPMLRITETRWFVHEHDEVSANTWKHPQVKHASNCAACHVNAGLGRYNEHDIRLPR